jgi:hypothetical protein
LHTQFHHIYIYLSYINPRKAIKIHAVSNLDLSPLQGIYDYEDMHTYHGEGQGNSDAVEKDEHMYGGTASCEMWEDGAVYGEKKFGL